MVQINKGIFPVVIYEYIKQNTDQIKHTTILEIADHLKHYTDEIQKDSRIRTVERHLCSLAQFDENICVVLNDDTEDYKPYETPAKDIKEIYYDQPFNSTDIHILSDAIIYSKHLRLKERENLLKKLSNLSPSNKYDWYKNAIHETTELMQDESQLFRNLEFIDYAISEKKCLSFKLATYRSDKKLHNSVTYKGFSPYKIFIDNNTYYVVGAFRSEKNHLDKFMSTFPESTGNKTVKIYRFEVYRIQNISPDDKSVYIKISDTDLHNRSISDICKGDYNIYNILCRTLQPKDKNVEFCVNRRGLHVLIQSFGRNIFIKKTSLKELPSKLTNKLQNNDEDYYIVTLKNATHNDWNTILRLLHNYPVSDIALLSHHDAIKRFINLIIKNISMSE